MQDSRKFKKGHPMVFHLGHYQSIKCWELAIISMQAGEVVDMDCPSYFAYGGAPYQSHFGAKMIPANSDLEFKLEVLECQPSIDLINEKNLESQNKAPLIEKMSEYEQNYPIIGSGLIVPTDQQRDNNIEKKKAPKISSEECAMERMKQLKLIEEAEITLKNLK